MPAEEAAGEGGHFCEMKRPQPQKYYEKMAFFDTGEKCYYFKTQPNLT